MTYKDSAINLLDHTAR